MTIIIDGHNLIPHLPGLSLADIDDELQLVEMLQKYCQLKRKKVEVFFDGAPPGQARKRLFGNVIAHFVPQGQTADQAILNHLNRLRGAAKNLIVVSSDRQVRSLALERHARNMPADVFAQHLLKTLTEPGMPEEHNNIKLTPEAVQKWLELFEGGKIDDDQ